MNQQSQIKTLFAAIALMVGTVGFAQAQARSEEGLLLEATQKALADSRAAAAAAQAENARLKEQVKQLGLSLAEANRFVRELDESYKELRLETEALGLASFTKGEKGMSERLLKAISDNRIVEAEREAMAHALLDLSDAIKSYMTTAVCNNAETRSALQAALNKSAKVIGIDRRGAPVEPKKTLDQGKIISLKRDFGILVFNLGERDGARIGMPFDVYRRDRRIGTAMIADVRDNISSALITKLIDESDDAQVGDRVKVQTQKNL